MTDSALDLVARLNATIDDLSRDGIEVQLTIQRVPVVAWRFLKPVVKITTKLGRPL